MNKIKTIKERLSEPKTELTINALYSTAAYCGPDFVVRKGSNIVLNNVHQVVQFLINTAVSPIESFSTQLHQYQKEKSLSKTTSQNYSAKMSGSWYDCGPATAFVNLDGKEIRISFTGTDEGGDIKNWINFNRHYSLYAPLIEKVLNYAQQNNCYIKATGHSLGGAMVEKFMAEATKSHPNLEVSGCTFGSPGSKEKLSNPRLINVIHNDDIVPQIGDIIYNHNGENIFIKRQHRTGLVSSHLVEEYVESAHFLDKTGYKLNQENIVDIENPIFRSFSLEDHKKSVHLRFKPIAAGFKKIKTLVSSFKELLENAMPIYALAAVAEKAARPADIENNLQASIARNVMSRVQEYREVQTIQTSKDRQAFKAL